MTATFTWRPTYGGRNTKKPKTFEAQYGDGYTQRGANGINNNPESWSLTFDERDDVEASAIMSFLDTANAVSSFYWTNMDGVTNLYICRTYSRAYEDEDKNQVQATFDQVFGG